MPVVAKKSVRSKHRGGRGVKTPAPLKKKIASKRGGYLSVRAPQNTVHA